MVERALDADLPVAWVVGDTVYRSAQPLRAALEACRQAYAPAVACRRYRGLASEWIRLAREDWQELSAGAGSKGPRFFAWARIELTAPEINGWQHWLLLRRSLDEGTKPAEMAYVLVSAPTGTSLEEMVKDDEEATEYFEKLFIQWTPTWLGGTTRTWRCPEDWTLPATEDEYISHLPKHPYSLAEIQSRLRGYEERRGKKYAKAKARLTE